MLCQMGDGTDLKFAVKLRSAAKSSELFWMSHDLPKLFVKTRLKYPALFHQFVLNVASGCEANGQHEQS